MRIFKRKLYDKLLDWKQESRGQTALLIKGARRVGKSTLATEFAKNEYKSHIVIDFAIAPKEVIDLFKDISDLNYIFMRLQLLYQVNLHEHESVIIFDEIQRQPLARQAIKYLVQDGRYDYIETGSLLSIKQNIKNIVIPSEETRITLFPMDFEEFKWALGDEVTVPILRQAFESKKGLGDDFNRKMMRGFRLYMLVGGMPQAVDKYIETNNLSYVDAVKRNILELYEDDFRKIDPTGMASMLFASVPSQLAQDTSRYIATNVISETNSLRVAELIAEMKDSETINIAYHANDPSAGFGLSKNIDKYKIYMADTGLFVTLAFKDKDFTENEIYNKLLNDKMDSNLGYLFENVVAQMLRASGKELYYYTFPSPSKHYYEIDFLLSKGNKVCPIEVKSSGYKSHKSLDNFSVKFQSRISDRYLIYTKDLRRDKGIDYLPVYMTMFL